jgi:cell volume regulation protein A
VFAVDRLILVGAILLLIGIVSSKFSARLGLPVLVLFLGVGMLAGSEGIGGIYFDNPLLAHGIGSIALAIILFDGGLRTSLASVRLVWKPAAVLATAGVLITSLITGAFASAVLGISLLHGMLLGSIIGSTDAAAVFLVLRSRGVRLTERLSSLLEIESASNDPMAIFLTVGLLEVLLGRMPLGPGLLKLFIMQMGIGAVLGVLGGRLGARAINRINLDAAGLYPLLTWAIGMLTFGVAAALGGSGFLAVYIAGIVLGNSRLVFRHGTLVFHDGLTWMSQISMFVVLGLLSFPSELMRMAGPSLLIAAALMFLARPIAVALCIWPFRFAWREVVFISWTGLKGAVPVILGIYPLVFGLPDGALFFNVVFFVVLVSTVVQGWSLAPVARWLGLQQPEQPAAPVTLEITSLRDVDGDIVEYTIGPKSRACGHTLREMAFPEGVVVAMIARGDDIVPPRGSTRIKAGDHVFVVMRPGARPLVDRAFADRDEPAAELPSYFEFPLQGSTTVSDLEEFYGITGVGPAETTLEELLRRELGNNGVSAGASVHVDGVTLRVREIAEGRVEWVGLSLDAPAASAEPDE